MKTKMYLLGSRQGRSLSCKLSGNGKEGTAWSLQDAGKRYEATGVETKGEDRERGDPGRRIIEGITRRLKVLNSARKMQLTTYIPLFKTFSRRVLSCCL